MADSTLNAFLGQGTTTQRTSFTPTPPTPASGLANGYLIWDHTLQQLFAYDTTSNAYVAVAPASGSGVSGSGLTSGLVVVGAGGTSISVAANSVPILKATVSLTDAQVKALPTTPIQLVAAPGAGFRIQLLQASISANLTGVYTNVNASAYCVLALAANEISNYIANDATTSPILSDATKLFATNTLSTAIFVNFSQVTTPAANQWGNAVNVNALDFQNQALNLTVNNNGAGNFTGGNAANAFAVHVLYTVVSVP